MAIYYDKNEEELMDQAPPLLPGFEHINRYWDASNNIYAAKLLPGDFYVSLHGELITTVLGSCISACIRDPKTGIGGMNHFMLPTKLENTRSNWAGTPVSSQTRYGNIAMERLINLILSSGSRKQDIEIKLFGGGKVLDISTDIGGRNIDFVRTYLNKEGLNITSEDVGGSLPRKIQYYPLTGRVRVKKLNAMHNLTLTIREKEYITYINKAPVEGKIDIF